MTMALALIELVHVPVILGRTVMDQELQARCVISYTAVIFRDLPLR